MSATPDRSSHHKDDEFYVGYLPTPPNHRVILLIVAVFFIVGLGALALVAARSQPDPGVGVWEYGNTKEFRGVVHAAPYPILLADDLGDGEPGTLLLVEEGKFSGGARAASADGRRVMLKGALLYRDGLRMLELIPGEAAIQIEAAAGPARGETSDLGDHVVRGEIVDSKCFAGAMKPGTGKTHKECAMLCVRGGIPPVLVANPGSAGPRWMVLTGQDGEPLGEWALPFIADKVEVSGRLESRDGLVYLRVRVGGIRGVGGA